MMMFIDNGTVKINRKRNFMIIIMVCFEKKEIPLV